MLEMLGTGISTMLHFIMDNIVIINIILSLIIVFFVAKVTTGCVDMAAAVVFYTDCWIYPVSGHWSGFPQEQDVQGKGD